MSDIGTTIAPLTIAILSRQCLVWLGLQNILESSTTLPMVVHPHAWRVPDGSLPATQPDVFILDLETEPDALTEREREIIRLVGQGLSNKDIAYTLSISDSTVRHHMTNIFDKVGVPNRQKLLLHAHHVRSSPL
jgi:DNA-binding NarL/FixJ family response regulator